MADIPKKFDNDEPLARSSDDSTSHEAAEKLTASGKRDTDKHQVLSWMIAQGSPRPLGTAKEMSRDSGMKHEMVHKRLSDLMRDGWVCKGPRVICSVTETRATTWMLVDKSAPEPETRAEDSKQAKLFE